MYKSYQLLVVWYSTECYMTNEGKCIFLATINVMMLFIEIIL